MMIVCHESICTGNDLYRFFYILEVVCQWLKVHTSSCYSRDLCSKYERDNSATNATNQPVICFTICLFRWSNMPKLSWPAQIDDLHLILIVDLSSISNTTIVGFLILPAYMQWQRLFRRISMTSCIIILNTYNLGVYNQFGCIRTI
jgi:hypothetical protein